MTHPLIEKVMQMQRRYTIHRHGDEWIVFDQIERLAVENCGREVNAGRRCDELAAQAAIDTVLEEVRELVVRHKQAADACAANKSRSFKGTKENHIGAASACEEITMYLDALRAELKEPGA